MKLATELYDSDDAAPSRTPPLLRQTVNLTPSPSPEYPSPPPRSPSPESLSTSKRRGRRRRTQPSQSDRVLIGVLGGLNNPDIANRAAESPLNSASQSEAGDSDVQMEEVGEGERNPGRNLLQVAQDAINVGGQHEARSRSCSPRTDSVRRVQHLKLQTRALNPQLRGASPSGRTGVKEEREVLKGLSSPLRQVDDDSNMMDMEQKFIDTKAMPPAQEDTQLGRNGAHTTMISPQLRKHTIAEGSPMATLPAIQSPPNSATGKSPNNQQNLPSLHHLALPLDARSPKENDLRSLSISQRSTFPMQSPSTVPLPSRATFPSHHTRVNGQFQPTYPPPQPSPASTSTFSETSPREGYRHSADSTAMSPPGKPERTFYHSGRTSQSDELTPASSESYQSTASSVETPLSAENLNTEGSRPILPPLDSGPYAPGVFRCDFPGCTAVPFQTQYLLKWVFDSAFAFSRKGVY